MLKRYRHHILAASVLLVVAAVLLLWSQMLPNARLQHLKVEDGTALVQADAGRHPQIRVLLAVPDGQVLDDTRLLALAHDTAARIVQVAVPENDCAAQQHRLQAALKRLDGAPTLVAGIGPGAALAWRWLAGQDDDKARALSVGFSLEHPDCAQPLPESAAHGHWLAAWNDNPDDASARFVRGQANAETLIGDYDTALPQLLEAQLRRLLQGQGNELPVVDVPAAQSSDTLTLFYSGDGGWRDLDRAVAEEMAKGGYPVIGIDSLRYFWEHKSPEQGAADLARLMRQHRQAGMRHFVLVGYSFGADVLPAIYNRLPAAEREQVDAVVLLALARSGSFEIEVQGWLGSTGQEAATVPELVRLPPARVLCVYGREEAGESGCTDPAYQGERLALPGGHHFDENYAALAERLIRAIRARTAGAD
ncbi:virulence factor family protein [Pseudomonas sp. PIC25]|uniref:virulence factor family protein n=1 Tax=Pseudomonas sp. PIC25 TaxID=1958773 RepID=UPI000BAB3B59|nr:AcvB/VirJ family lysyl-phosphatidylglycerol hydrolase [Pseudomonas sp. PIC25]PAU52066.1 virulence factor family protein [Pseudomonas sp. PIC25]